MVIWGHRAKRPVGLRYPAGLLAGVFVLLATGCREPAATRGGGAEDIRVEGLRCEMLVDPLGIETLSPRLSWAVTSERRGFRQGGYRILAASSREKLLEDAGDLWDSGKVDSEASVHAAYHGKRLRSGQTCWWKVRVWDAAGRASGWSEPAMWSMGLPEPEDWRARWIGQQAPASAEAAKEAIARSIYPLPIFRKEFTVRPGLRQARVYVSGLGHYELFLNGEKVGGHFLDPAWSLYEKTVYYNTFDVTGLLRPGDNAFGVMLGKGFYSTAGDRRIHFVKSYRPLKLILQAHLLYEDGSEETVISDGSWKYTRGPLTHCAILGGSSYDARMLPEGWCRAGFRDTGWRPAEETPGPGGVLTAFAAPAMEAMRVFEPVAVDEPEPGIFVYDFGQNAAAVPRLSVQGAAGSTVRLTPAEQRHGQTGVRNDGKGRVNQARIGRPNYWEYTLRGGETEQWTPSFTYSGYQYLEVSGAAAQGRENPNRLPVIKGLHSVQVRNASRRAGTFECSNPLFNAIDRLIDWSVQSNMAHVLTDCPHREKLGWLEQSYLMGPSILWNYDAGAFFAKKVRDMRDSQADSGEIVTVAPAYPVFEGAFQYSPEWGAAGVFVPWLLYEWYGDEGVLRENYGMMTRFTDYMEATSEDLIARPGLGDWYDYVPGKAPGYSNYTPTTLTATAIFYGCADATARTAALLGKMEDAQRYRDLCERIKAKFNREFFDGRGAYRNEGSPQTANAMALVLGLAEPAHREAILQTIIDDLERRGWQQTTGDIGTYYLVQALIDAGRSDVIYSIVNRDEAGSYGYFIKQGWTCLPEAWDAALTSSMNHLMLGHIQQWFQQCLVGIRPDAAGPGFKRFILRPEPVGDVTWCRGSHTCLYGTIESAWRLEDDGFVLEAAIPANTSATVYLPAESAARVFEGAGPATQAEGVRFLRMEDGRAVLEVQSGRYEFCAVRADSGPAE